MKKLSPESIRKKLERINENLLAQFETIREEYEHKNERGRGVEETIRRFIDNYYSPIFDVVCRKEILDSDFDLSSQFDVLILRKTVVPHGLSLSLKEPSEKTGISLPLFRDAVAAVVEVKSTLDRRGLVDSIAKLKEAKVLKKWGSASASNRIGDDIGESYIVDIDEILTVLFAFKDKIGEEKIIDILKQQYEKDSCRPSINAVVLFESDKIVVISETKGIDHYGPQYRNGKALLKFLQVLQSCSIPTAYGIPLKRIWNYGEK